MLDCFADFDPLCWIMVTCLFLLSSSSPCSPGPVTPGVLVVCTHFSIFGEVGCGLPSQGHGIG